MGAIIYEPTVHQFRSIVFHVLTKDAQQLAYAPIIWGSIHPWPLKKHFKCLQHILMSWIVIISSVSLILLSRRSRKTQTVYNLQAPSPKPISPNCICIHSAKQSGFVFFPRDEKSYLLNAVIVSVFNTYKVFVTMTRKKKDKNQNFALHIQTLSWVLFW